MNHEIHFFVLILFSRRDYETCEGQKFGGKGNKINIGKHDGSYVQFVKLVPEINGLPERSRSARLEPGCSTFVFECFLILVLVVLIVVKEGQNGSTGRRRLRRRGPIKRRRRNTVTKCNSGDIKVVDV